MHADDLATVIDGLHEATLEPEHWTNALSQLARFIGDSAVVVLSAYHPKSGAHLLQSIGFNEEYWGRVQAEHSDPRTNRYISLINSTRPGQVLQPRETMTISDWLDDPIYRKFLRPDRLADGLICPLSHEGGGFSAIATFRGIHYDTSSISSLQSLSPHLRHAVRVHTKLNKLNVWGDVGSEIINNLQTAVIVSDRDCRPVQWNARAQHIFALQDGISVSRGGLLTAAQDGETKRLRELVERAHTAAVRGRRRQMYDHTPAMAGGTISISRPSGRRPFNALISPIRSATIQQTIGSVQPSVMIFLSLPEASLPVSLEAMKGLYGVTRAEGRLVLELVAGKDLDAASISLGIGINTAKTLLKRVFNRVDVNRQTALVALILRGPLGNLIIDR
jgi:DNA-binding CsgD family transcriptional regulator